MTWLPFTMAAVGVALLAAGIYVITGADEARYDATPLDTPEQLALYAIMIGTALVVLSAATTYLLSP